MDYISRDELRKHLADCMTAEFFDSDMKKAVVGIDVYVENMPAADVKPVEKTEFQIGYEQGFNDGRASAALPNIIDNGDKIDDYTYMYKTDSRGEPYIHIDSVRDMLKKAADVQPVIHAHWKRGEEKGFRTYNPLWYCSNCGERIRYDTRTRTYQKTKRPVWEVNAFCRKCGARMDGDTP